jgi:thiamine-phosphate diphosphorylase
MIVAPAARTPCFDEPDPMTFPPDALPPFYLVTPEPADAGFDVYLGQLDQALEHGLKLVQLRAKSLSDAAYEALFRQVSERCRRAGARLLLNLPADNPLLPESDGVHLSSARLMACSSRPLPAGKLVSAACHDAGQLRHAEAIGADLATLSPVLATASHPGAPALGWERFARLAAGTRLPVYALGGMSAGLLETARAHGAYGIAAIGAFWPARPPA